MRTIGQYEITAELGRGAMGEVYKARDPFIGRLVALKVITSALTNKPELLERFYQEARSAGALQHPNIVTVYKLGKEGDLPFIAMEFVSGESLEKMISRQAPLSLAQKVGYVAQICRALQYAHNHGVVHRDIKPGNVMVTTEGTVKVVDFGIARLVDASKTQTGTLIGTLGYMSPQQLRGEHADNRSDIWAVGVLFYELLVYQRPFHGENPPALMLSIISQEPQPLGTVAPDCIPEIEAIVARMLQKEATSRYQSMEEVLLDLEPVCKRLQQERVADLIAESRHMTETQDFKGAQQVLREALHIDSTRQDAKSLLDQVSRDLRRQEVQPQVQEHAAKAQSLLQAGQWQEAKAEAQAALLLDSTFEPARDLLAQVEQAVERSRELDKQLRVSKQRLAEGSLTEADRQLDDLLSLDPANEQAQVLRRQIQDEMGRREHRKRLAGSIQKARDLWSQLRYADCVAALLDLQKEFPDNAEIAKLLETARRDQAETEKQGKLAEVRGLLAAQQYEKAREALTPLQQQFPHDAAVQNLLTLVLDEQGIEERKRRFEQELEELRALVNDGKHAEALRRGEPLLVEFPQEFGLAELVNFARAELRRGDQSQRLELGVRHIRELGAQGSYAAAARIADELYSEFPSNLELKVLRDEARKKQQEKDRRGELDKRIREVKARMSRNEITDAIEMAKETLATLGPDDDVKRLLATAEVEHTQREKKKEQDRTVDQARTLLGAGKIDEATSILDQALATQILDTSDARVKTLFVEMEKQKQVNTAHTLLESGRLDEATAIVNRGLATQMLDASDPLVQQFFAEAEKRKEQTTIAPPTAPSSATVFSATTISENPPQAPATRIAPPPAATAPLPARPAKPARVQAAPSAGPKPAGNNWMLMAVAGMVVIVIAAAGIYFAVGRRAAPPPRPAPVAAAPAPARLAVNPLQQQQQQLIDQAQQMIASGDFAGAAQKVTAGLNLNGPLNSDLQNLQTQIEKARGDEAAKAAIEKENRLWSQGLAAYRQDELDVATRNFQAVERLRGGIHTADARKYLNTLIPQARNADQVFQHAQTVAAQSGDAQTLQQASQDLQQVIDGGGAHALQASALQTTLKSMIQSSAVLQQLMKDFAVSTHNPAALHSLQVEFRNLESVPGPIGRQANTYAEQRIPAALNELEAAAPKPKAAAPPPSAPGWTATVDAGSHLGLLSHPLPEPFVAAAMANHSRFELRLTVDKRGRVVGGWVVSGDANAGKALLKSARQSWQFSGATIEVSVLVTLQF